MTSLVCISFLLKYITQYAIVTPINNVNKPIAIQIGIQISITKIYGIFTF